MRNIFVSLLLILSFSFAVASDIPTTFKNPILSGFHPDPSICRVADDYYMVNSSFEWFPEIPIYKSKDLVNWKLIGYGINRVGQLDLLPKLGDSRGIYAVTIRYHEGIFYLITTCVQGGGNFYVTATDPAGEWSDPIWLNSKGIDPSLFWDDNGKCYYVGHANISGRNDWPQQNGAWMQEFDLKSKKLVGEKKQLTFGYASNARWTEGPHIYKIDGKYMLLVAEGGTGFHHSVTVFNSDNIWGPYIPNHSNPVMTHRNLGSKYPIQATGHSDLVQTQNGEWWAVMLGKRIFGDYCYLARETFLTPVSFEYQEKTLTPVFNPGVGHLLSEQIRPNLPWTPYKKDAVRDDFNDSKLNLKWNFLRTPLTKWYNIKKGKLEISLRPEVTDSLVNPSLIAKRMESIKFRIATEMEFKSKKANEDAGIIIYRASNSFVQFVRRGDNLILVVKRKGKRSETYVAKCDNIQKLVLQTTSDGKDLSFAWGINDTSLEKLIVKVPLSVISDEESAGFNGSYVGMYASSNGNGSNNKAYFNWFDYEEFN